MQPGHQGIWSEPLRTGKYTLNPRIYEAEIVPTSILTLNWSDATSEAHSLDVRLSRIDAKSKDAEEALGLARAKGFSAQRRAIGAGETALVAACARSATGA